MAGLGSLISITVAGRVGVVVTNCCEVIKEVYYCYSRGGDLGKEWGFGQGMGLWATRWLGKLNTGRGLG